MTDQNNKKRSAQIPRRFSAGMRAIRDGLKRDARDLGTDSNTSVVARNLRAYAEWIDQVI